MYPAIRRNAGKRKKRVGPGDGKGITNATTRMDFKT